MGLRGHWPTNTPQRMARTLPPTQTFTLQHGNQKGGESSHSNETAQKPLDPSFSGSPGHMQRRIPWQAKPAGPNTSNPNPRAVATLILGGSSLNPSLATTPVEIPGRPLGSNGPKKRKHTWHEMASGKGKGGTRSLQIKDSFTLLVGNAWK